MATRRVFLHPDGRRAFIHYEDNWYAIWALDRYKQFDRAALNVLPVKTMAGDTGTRLYAALEDWARAQHCDEITDPLVLARFEVDLACALRDRHIEQVANREVDPAAAVQEPSVLGASTDWPDLIAPSPDEATAAYTYASDMIAQGTLPDLSPEALPVTVAETPDALEISREIPQAMPVPVAVGAFLPIDQVHASPLNPRKSFNPETLDELAANIREFGVLQPLTVRPRDEGGYWVIFGERRYRASLQAGLTEIPCIIRPCDQVEHLRLAIIENLHRDQVDAIEEANGFQSLVQLGVSPAEIAAQVNRSPSYISNAMRLLDLPEVVQVQIRIGALSASHGRALARFKQYPRLITALAKIAVDDHVPSKALEGSEDDLIRKYDCRLGVSCVIPLNAYCGEYRTHFDWRSLCKTCKDRRDSCCLRPSCWKEKESAHADVERARRAALVAETLGGDMNPDGLLAAAGGLQENRGIVSRSSLNAADFTWLDKKCPNGCKPDCPQRGITKERGESRAICLDPMCYAKLEALEKERTRRDRQTLAEGRLALILHTMALTEPGRLLAFGAWRSWQRLGDRDRKRVLLAFPAFEAALADCPDVAHSYGDIAGQQCLQCFSSFPPDDLARFMAYASLCPDVWSTVTSEYSPATPLADWFLGEAAPAPIREPYDPGDGDAVTPSTLTTEEVCHGPAFCDGWKAEGDCVGCSFLRTCRICGCTPEHACALDDGPCTWVTVDLCSGCAEMTPAGVQLLTHVAAAMTAANHHLPSLGEVAAADVDNNCPREGGPRYGAACSEHNCPVNAAGVQCANPRYEADCNRSVSSQLYTPPCLEQSGSLRPGLPCNQLGICRHCAKNTLAGPGAGICIYPALGSASDTLAADNSSDQGAEGELPDPPDPRCEGCTETTCHGTAACPRQAPPEDHTGSPCTACTADQCPPGGKTQCERFMTWSEVAR